MRNHLAGTAVTESEKKFLEPLVSSLTDKKGIFINKLDEISGNALTRYNNTRAAGGLPELNTNQLLDKAKRISLYGSGPTSTNNSIDNEQAAKDSIINYGKANPADQEMIKGLLSDPNYTFEEVKQILNIK
jgi:fumarate hydratase class II